MCMLLYMCVSTHAHLYMEPREVSLPVPLYIEEKSLAESGACSPSQLTPEIPCLPSGITAKLTRPTSSCVGLGNLSSGSQTSTASTLPTQQSPEPRTPSFGS